VLSNVGFAFTNMTVNTYMPVYSVEALQLFEQLVAFLGTMRATAMISLRLMSGTITARATSERLLMFILTDLAVAGFAFALCRDCLQPALVTVIQGLGWGMIFPVNATTITKAQGPPRERWPTRHS